ncbi:MAG: ABC transporter substrate-binding protein [Pseudomonadota bacterium]
MRDRIVFLAVWICLFFAGPLQADFTRDNPAQVHMVTFRGCEEACQGFQDFFADRDLPVEVTVTDIARDQSVLPDLVTRLRAKKPDLVVTWGTSVSTSLIGTLEDGPATPLGDIPVLFMIVADPVRSGLIETYAASGRPTVTGVRNRVPEEAQMRTLFEYFEPGTIGVLNDANEANSGYNTEELIPLADAFGFELIEATYSPGPSGAADPAEIPKKIAELAALGAEAIYVGSSSFNLQHADVFTAAALDHGLPVFSAYEQMVSDADALMAVANSYVNVGKLAASQAQSVLFEDELPGDLPIATLDRYSIIINMRVARALELYPPIQLIGIAEIVE